jgi:sensor histidine kinase YesM
MSFLIKNQIKSWLIQNKIHFLVWALYMFQESVITSILSGNYSHPLIYLVHYAVIIVLFYFFGDYSLPWAVKSKTYRFWKILFIVFFQIIVYAYSHYWASLGLIFFKIEPNQLQISFDTTFVLRNFYRCVVFMMFAAGYYFLKTYIAERKKSEALEKQRLEEIIKQQQIVQELVVAQNAVLKAQINPHFLFNTLDFIYHKINHHSEVTGEAVIKLSQMMRFAIETDQMEETIKLSDEIEQVENLMYLYQIRKSSALNVDFAYTEEVKQIQFIPLVLLTLMENIFKHANLSTDDDKATLQIEIIDELFHISSFNLIHPKKAVQSNQSGLANIQKRLNYAYGEEAVFEQTSTPTHFKVQISIPIRLLQLQNSFASV